MELARNNGMALTFVLTFLQFKKKKKKKEFSNNCAVSNQKEIYKAGATNYLVTILINKDRYNNDEMVANALFLCWVIAKVAPKGIE